MCEHDVEDDAELLWIVDGPIDGLDPVLVVQASTCALAPRAVGTLRFIEFVGDLDSYTADGIDPVLCEIADENADVVVDLCGLAFCDSAGFRQIERFCDRITANGAQVWVHESSRAVLRLVSLLGVTRLNRCEGRTTRSRSLRFDATVWSKARVWEWEGRLAHFGSPDDRHRPVRLVELAGRRRAEGRERFAIDLVVAPLEDVTSSAVRGRHSTRFVVIGELDGAAIAEIGPLGWPGLDRVHHVTVDLAGVTLMTSAGLRLLEHLDQHVRGRGGRFFVVNPSRIVVRIIDTLARTFERAPTVTGVGTATSRSISTTQHRKSQRLRSSAAVPGHSPTERTERVMTGRIGRTTHSNDMEQRPHLRPFPARPLRRRMLRQRLHGRRRHLPSHLT
ncbi:MAG: STAS domain-containing protein [Ilumatobacter sp.]|uniref:STAS domain-containing protein n=1 Tax=Ilumatobacter sp. TaxID=1967498 RepID=UPI003C71D489